MGLGLIDKPHLQRFKSRMDILLSGKVGTNDYATTNDFGIVKPDGTSITVNNGVISSNGGYVLPTASRNTLGGVKIDGDTINIDANGVISATARSVDFSINEQYTGVEWINGESIYQITISTSVSCLANQWNEIANAPSSLDKIIQGFVMNNSSVSYPEIKVENNKLYVYPTVPYLLKNLTIYYTKSAVAPYIYSQTWNQAHSYKWEDFSETKWKEQT